MSGTAKGATDTKAAQEAEASTGASDSARRARRALVVAYCFPPHAAIGTHRTLRLVSHLSDRGWDVGVLTARAEAYLSGTPIDGDLIQRIPSSIHVVRTGALRGFSKAGRIIGRFRSPRRETDDAARANEVAERFSAAQAPGVAQRFSAAQALGVAQRFSAAQAPGVAQRFSAAKALVEELCALPDKEVGWLAPAVLRGLRAFSATPPDVIFSSAPPWTTHLVAYVLASAFRCPWVADFRDPWVRSPWTRYKTGPGVAIARRLEERVVRRADGVVFTTETARQEFAEYYGAEVADRFHVVFNGCDPSEFDASPPPGSNGRFVLLHAGSLYGGRSPLPLLRAVAGICRQDPRIADRLRVRFLGSTGFPGVDVPAVCADLGIPDIVQLAPRVGRLESLNEMRSASALLILQPGTAVAIPGKLYEYMAAGRPILALCKEGEMAEVIRSNRVGLAVAATSEPEIERALLALLGASADSWALADASLYDGRLRAAEVGAILEAVLSVTCAPTLPPAQRPRRNAMCSRT